MSATPQEQGSGQFGHGVVTTTGVETGGQALVPLSTPVTGTHKLQSSLALVPVNDPKQSETVSRATPAPPQTDFPRFDGENPRLWQKAAEKYFRLFSVDLRYRVEYATMHFTGNAAMWLQSVEDQLGNCTWEMLCEKLGKQFDRGQYQLLYRQAFKLKQNGSVVEYIEKFNTLIHHMLAYKNDIDPTFSVTRFIEGLSREIRAVVMIQRPEDLDIVVALALLQEEIEDDVPKFAPKQAFRPGNRVQQGQQQCGRRKNSSCNKHDFSTQNFLQGQRSVLHMW